VDYTGSPMPPPEAIASGKVTPLTDEDRRTLVRWIDLGCPIDLDHGRLSYGWMLDDQRPTLTLTLPQAGANRELSRILVGMHDYGSGLDLASFRVVADFAIEGLSSAGEDLAPQFRPTAQGVWELRLPRPIAALTSGTLTVSVADKQGNVTLVARRFSVRPEG